MLLIFLFIIVYFALLYIYVRFHNKYIYSNALGHHRKAVTQQRISIPQHNDFKTEHFTLAYMF